MSDPTPAAQSSPSRHWSRGLRPLLWWLLLVLWLYACRTHQQLSERTRLIFNISLQSKPVYDASPTLDGRPIASEDRVPLGWHRFAISHPKTEPFETNLFIWYGEHRLGTVVLQRATGVLTVEVVPPAAVLKIHGPEFAVILTSSPGLTSSVPTDTYVVEARFTHWDQRDEVSVGSGGPTSWRIAPRFGVLHLWCNQTDATFQVLSKNDRLMSAGGFPDTISGLPEGRYNLLTRHHLNRHDQELAVKAGNTNDVRVDFMYGTAVLETTPTGATVISSDGQEWGVTPLTLLELEVGTKAFTLLQQGYEPARVEIDVAANQTNVLRTNLVSRTYTAAMSAAHEFLTAANYERAVESLDDALRAKPGDAVATSLWSEAAAWVSLHRSEARAAEGNYMAAIQDLESAIKARPDDGHMKQLMANYREREREEIERRKLARLTKAKELFDKALEGRTEAELFESHELKTKTPVKEVETALLRTFKEEKPTFGIMRYNFTDSESFGFQAQQDVSGGRRVCIVVGAQRTDDETQILFKVLEFKSKHRITFESLLSFTDNVDYIALHSLRAGELSEKQKGQIEEGQRLVEGRIQRAIGKSSATDQ